MAGPWDNVPEQQQQPAAANSWTSWLNDDSNRAALLQAGLTLMQPVPIGQAPIGQLAQAIGAGAQAAQRVEAQEYAEDDRAAKAENEATKLDILRQRANAATTRANRPTGARSMTSLLRQEASDLALFNRQIEAEARSLYKDANDSIGMQLNPSHPAAKYKGMTLDQIRASLNTPERRTQFQQTQAAARTPATPATPATAPAATPASVPATEFPRVSTVEEAEALPPGTWFIDPAGVKRYRP